MLRRWALPALLLPLFLDAWVAGLETSTPSGGSGSVADLVFFAGVEGAGHHFMQSLIQHVPHTVAYPSGSWTCGAKWDSSHYQETVEKFKALAKSRVNILNPFWSYPMYCETHTHEDRMHDNFPRLDWMDQAAREAGAHLQVLLLYRKMEDCLAADCLHRSFEACPEQSETLISNAAILASHLRGLNPDQIVCLRFGDIESMKTSIKDAFDGRIPEGLVDDAWRESDPKHRREKYKGWDSLASQLQEADDALERICAESEQVTLLEVVANCWHSDSE